MTCAEYFQNTRAPQWLDERRDTANAFLEYQHQSGNCIAVVTSGGTIVPLERNMVRFLDNFSTGSRGAAAVEYFIKLGYAVIYLYRPGSVTPFARHFQQSNSSHDDLQFMERLAIQKGTELQFLFDDDDIESLLDKTVRPYQSAKEKKSFLALPFKTVSEYLFSLRLICQIVRPWQERVLFYLSAAVSDFYIPDEKLLEHKMQSSNGNLTLELQQTPKMLGVMRSEYAPNAFYVSFKLETNWDLLLEKARSAIRNYGVHLVIANELHSRYHEVLLVSKDDARRLIRPSETADIDLALVDAVANMHFKFISSHVASIPRSLGSHVQKVTRWHTLQRRYVPHKVVSIASFADKYRVEIAAVLVGGALSAMLSLFQQSLARQRWDRS